MLLTKITTMSKEKVHLREKVLAKGMIGLYLDYSVKGKRKQETLKGIKLFAKPKNKKERDYNKEISNKAREIRNNREHEIIANYYGETVIYKPKTPFVEFCEMIAKKKSDQTSTQSVWLSMIYQLKRFDRNARLIDLNEDWQERWKNHLLNSVKQNSAHSYNNKVRTAIKEAVDKKYIPSQKLVKGIPYEDVDRQYLTNDEIQALIKTECSDEQLKRAFLFSCFTGMRFSDVQRLSWNNVTSDNGNTYLSFKQKKTRWVENLPINKQAKELMDKFPNDSEKVFKGLKYSAENNHKLEVWVLRAGIKKKITFHCARHTNAVLLLSNGTDIYTVAKMLGHRDIKSTMVYLKFTDELKHKAMNALPSFEF